MYNPDELKREYECLEHGKAMLAGIRHAIEEADRNHDLPFMVFFRADYCRESCFYGEKLDMLVMFPQLLALVDENPSVPATKYNNAYCDSLDHVLWVYKWILASCCDFYQIPMEDCLHYCEDFKKRYLAYGYNLKTYYRHLSAFYQPINAQYSDECFHIYEKLPRDEQSDCEACDRNAEITFYLNHDDLEKAENLSRDIESFALTCGGRKDKDAWLRLKLSYMYYYIRIGNYEKAVEYGKIIQRNRNQKSEYDCWSYLLRCYTYLDLGKALKIYKANWKNIIQLRCPDDIFDNNKNASIFFRELMKARKGKSVKLPLDPSFPLYREDGEYEMAQLYRYHYGRAKDMADHFDARNGTDYFQKDLEENELFPLSGQVC